MNLVPTPNMVISTVYILVATYTQNNKQKNIFSKHKYVKVYYFLFLVVGDQPLPYRIINRYFFCKKIIYLNYIIIDSFPWIVKVNNNRGEPVLIQRILIGLNYISVLPSSWRSASSILWASSVFSILLSYSIDKQCLIVARIV